MHTSTRQISQAANQTFDLRMRGRKNKSIAILVYAGAREIMRLIGKGTCTTVMANMPLKLRPRAVRDRESEEGEGFFPV